MNIEVYTICYNEEFLMPFFLEHYTKHVGATKIIIYDNFSTDKCIEIAKAYKDCIVEVIPYDSNNTLNDEKYLEIKNNCWKGSTADWVIVCDIDEFLYFKNKDILNTNESCVFKCIGYQMISDTLPTHNKLLIEEIKDGVIDPNYSKCAIFKPTINEINYKPGSHNCQTTSKIIDTNILLLHYKFLSLEYVINNYKERRERLSETNIVKGYGVHYQYGVKQLENIYNQLKINKKKVI